MEGSEELHEFSTLSAAEKKKGLQPQKEEGPSSHIPAYLIAILVIISLLVFALVLLWFVKVRLQNAFLLTMFVISSMIGGRSVAL